MGRKNDGGLRALFRKKLKQVHWTSIESILTASGIPDSNGCFKGKEFWVEFKLARGWRVEMREGQISWISSHVRHGGRVVIAVKRRRELWLVEGKAVAVLARQGLRGLRRGMVAGCWEGGPARWPWEQVLARMAV